MIHGKETDVETRVMELTKGQGVDLVFETAGTAFTAQQTARLVKRGGTVVMVGMSANPKFEYDFGTLQNKEARICTVFRYRNLYPTAIELASFPEIDLKKIVTNTYSFSEIGQALEDSIEKKQDMVKAVIHME